MYLLYGLGIANSSVRKYFDENNISYKVFEDGKTNYINYDDVLNEINIIIKSPGILNESMLLQQAKKRKIQIITDIELFYNIVQPNFLICVSGSNGKTTVTKMLGNLLADEEFQISGNIGLPLFDYTNHQSKKYIVECSSYMLEYTQLLKPNIYILLNIEKHHLDHHHTFVNYIKAKIKPLKQMTEEDCFIYPKDNLLISRIANTYCVKKLPFSLEQSNVDFKNLKLIGTHNYLNVMTVINTLQALNINIEDKLNLIYHFEPLSHRLEILFKENNPLALFVNDSKSTNVFSTIVGVNSIINKFPNAKIHLILGGQCINQDYELIIPLIKYISHIYCYGEAGKIFMKYIRHNIYHFQCLKELLSYLNNVQFIKDDVVLFSPGAPSLDEFNSFEERGTFFIRNLNLKKDKSRK